MLDSNNILSIDGGKTPIGSGRDGFSTGMELLLSYWAIAAVYVVRSRETGAITPELKEQKNYREFTVQDIVSPLLLKLPQLIYTRSSNPSMNFLLFYLHR